jgi:tRNA A-37 threonylcarbamoyl transferase component Bud32
VPSCPTCHNTFPAGTDVCPRDGAPLLTTGASTQANLVMAATVPGLPAAPPGTGEGSPNPPASGSGQQSWPSSTRSPPTAPDGASSSSGSATPVVATAPAAAVEANEEGRFDPLVGAVLADRYQIVRRIGEGGMGAVYEAKHTVIGKRVAVKVLLEKFLAKSDFVARLLQEARLASSIGHEHIVDVTDFGTTSDGRSFVVMEFLDGESLAELAMREAPLPIERSLGIARQVASALGAAHAKGIFHRDVKPENVYLVRRGDADFVKVVDFGISKAVKPGGDDGGEGYRLTHTGLLLGTPLYMSPEQARGEEDLDHRVDIWALGVLLYECLTGEVPFRANNYLGIISQVLTHEPAPPSKLRPELGIADAVETVVMRAMDKDRSRRYQTMAELEHDLERLLAGDQNVGLMPRPGAPTRVAPAPKRWPLLLMGALTLGLAAASAVVLGPSKAPPAAPANVAPAAAVPTPTPPAQAAPVQVGPPLPVAAVPPAAPRPAHKKPRVKGESAATKPATPASPTGKSGEGRLPSGSKEAYPEK